MTSLGRLVTHPGRSFQLAAVTRRYDISVPLRRLLGRKSQRPEISELWCGAVPSVHPDALLPVAPIPRGSPSFDGARQEA